MRFVLPPRLALALSAASLTGLAACHSPEPGQLTVVQGTVTSATTGRPLPGVLMGIESYTVNLLGPLRFSLTSDSVRTDAQGKYELHLTNQKGLSYVASFEPQPVGYASHAPRYAFLTTGGGYDVQLGAGRQVLTIGRTNVVDFKPDEARTLALRIRNRNTGYQQLFFNYTRLHGNNLDTVAYLRDFYPQYSETKFTYRRLTAAGATAKDTLVSLVLQNPAALPPDTLRATLTFVR